MLKDIILARPNLRLLPRLPGPDFIRVRDMIQASDESFKDAVTSYRKYMVSTPKPADVTVGPLPAPPIIEGEPAEWPAFGMWQGWYWAEEIKQARRLGYDCLGYEGVAFPSWISYDKLLDISDAPEGYGDLLVSYCDALARLALYWRLEPAARLARIERGTSWQQRTAMESGPDLHSGSGPLGPLDDGD